MRKSELVITILGALSLISMLGIFSVYCHQRNKKEAEYRAQFDTIVRVSDGRFAKEYLTNRESLSDEGNKLCFVSEGKVVCVNGDYTIIYTKKP